MHSLLLRKLGRLLLIVVIAGIASGCGATTSEPTATAVTAPPTPTTAAAGGTSASAEVPVKAHYKFAWIMPDVFNPFWTYMRQGAEKAVREQRQKGIQVDIEQLAPIKTFNVEEQVAQ